MHEKDTFFYKRNCTVLYCTAGANGLYNKLNCGFSGCVETMKTGLENEVGTHEVIGGQRRSKQAKGGNQFRSNG